MAGKGVDWMFVADLSSQKAEEKLDAFAKKAKTILNTIPGVEIKVNTGKADADVDKFVARSLRNLNMIKDTTVRINSVQALKDIQTFSRAAASVTNKPITATITANNGQAMAAINTVKNNLGSLQGSFRMSLGGISPMGGAANGAGNIRATTSAIESQTKAVDFLGKAWAYSLLKFMEYEVIAKSMETTIHGLAASLHEASDVQFEMSLQKLYNPQVFDSLEAQNKAYANASIIAKAWGADVRDVLQVQGLWVKQTNDLAGATYLANKAEMMHRASGVDTLEVYRSSVAMATQLGMKLSELPRVYDQISEAALKLAVPLNNFSGKGKQEAMKDLFEGAAESAATLSSMGFTDKKDKAAGTIAIVANQIQATGDNAKSAAKNLTSMFAALEGRGKGRQVFESIIGKPEDIKGFDDLMTRLKDHVKELYQAYENGDLGVRPAQFETLATFEASLEHIKHIYDDIQKNSNGKLEIISKNQMELLQGQMDRLKTSMQLLGVSIGNELLPDALHFVGFLNTSLIPSMDHSADTIVNTMHALVALGGAMLIQQGFTKLATGIDSVRKAQEVLAITNNNATTVYRNLWAAGASVEAQQGALQVADARSTRAMQELIAQMEREKQALADLAAQAELTAWRTGGFADACARAGTTTAELGAVAGGSALSGVRAFATGLGEVVTSAARAYAPLLAIYEVMQSMDAFDKNKNAEVGLRLKLQGLVGNTGGVISEGIAHGPQVLLGRLAGKGSEFNQGAQDVHDIISAGKGSIADDMRVQWATLMRAKSKLAELQAPRRIGAASIGGGADYDVRKAELEHAQQVAITNVVKDWTGYKLQHDVATSTTSPNIPQTPPASTNTTIGQGAGEGPAYNKPLVDKTLSTPEGEIRNAIEQHKRDSMALMTVAQDRAEAGKMNEETAKKEAELNGWSAKGIKDLTAAYQQQISALKEKSSAAAQEATLLKHDLAVAQQVYAHTKEGTKAHLEAATSVSMANDAYIKAVAIQGMLAASVREVAAAEALAIQNARIDQELRSKAVNGGPKTLEEYRGVGGEAVRKVDEARKEGGLTGELAALKQQMADLATYHDNLEESLGRHPGSKSLQADLKSVDDAALQLKGKLAEIPGEIDKIFQSIQRIGQKSALKNADDAAEALGMDKRTVNAVKDYIEQLNSIQDEREQLKDKLRDLGAYSAGESAEVTNARNEVYWSQQQLDIQEKMLPVIEQHKLLEDEIAKIRKSAEYTSLDKSLNREGDNLLNQIIKRDFTESSHPTFGTQYGGRPTKSGGVLSGFLQDYTQTAGGDAIKSVTGHLLDGIFPVDKLKAQEQTNRDELKHIYTTAVSGQLTAAQMMLQASKNQQESAGVSSVDSTGTGFKYGPPAPGHGGATGFAYGPPASLAAAGAALSEIGKATKLTALNTDVNGNPSGLAAQYVAKMDEVTDKNPLGTFGAKGGFFGASKGAKGGQNFTLGNVMAGMGEGAAASVAFGTSGPWGSILGGVGGAFGPVGAAVGSIIGGLIGPHYNATKNPDMFNPAYGQWLSNMSGTQNMVNGTPVDPTKQFNTYLGYQSQSQQMASYVNSAQMIAELPPALKQFAQNIKNLENASGGGLGIRSEHNGMITLDSGKTVSVEDYMKWTTELQNYKDQMSNVPIAPLISMNAYGGNGMNPGGGKGYSTIGLTAQEVNALQLTAYGTKLNPSQAGPVGVAQPQYQASPYATPFTGAALGSSASQPIYVTNTGNAQQTLQTINLVVDSKVLASVVNAQNNQTLNAAGKIAA